MPRTDVHAPDAVILSAEIDQPFLGRTDQYLGYTTEEDAVGSNLRHLRDATVERGDTVSQHGGPGDQVAPLGYRESSHHIEISLAGEYGREMLLARGESVDTKHAAVLEHSVEATGAIHAHEQHGRVVRDGPMLVTTLTAAPKRAIPSRNACRSTCMTNLFRYRYENNSLQPRFRM